MPDDPFAALDAYTNDTTALQTKQDSFPALVGEEPAQRESRFQATQKMRVEDLKDRGIPSFKDTAGTVRPVADESGAPLTNYDSKNGIAYDSSGNPKKVSYSNPTGAPKLDDPFAGIPTTTDEKTGDQYKQAPGLPWQWTGKDPDVAATALAKEQDAAVSKASTAIGGQISQRNAERTRAEAALKVHGKSLEDTVPGVDLTQSPDDVHSQIDSAFDESLKSPEANAKAGWFSKDLSPAAKEEQARIEAQRTQAHSLADNAMQAKNKVDDIDKQNDIDQQVSEGLHQRIVDGSMQRLKELGVNIQLPHVKETEAAKAQVNGDDYNTQLTPDEETQFQQWKAQYAPNDSGVDYDLRGAFKAGLTPDPTSGHWPDTFKKPNEPTFSDQSIYAKDRPDLAGSWRGDTFILPRNPVLNPADAQPAVDTGTAPEATGTPAAQPDTTPKSYTVDKSGTPQFEPGKQYEGLQQAAKDGVVPQDFADGLSAKAKQADAQYADLVKAAGNNSTLKAAIGSGAIGASTWAAGAAAGAWIGAAAGSEVPIVGNVIGAVIGGMIGGWVTHAAAEKFVEKLGAYNDTVNSFNASVQLHPHVALWSDVAGSLITPEGPLRLAGEGIAKISEAAAVQSLAKSFTGSGGGLWGTIKNLAGDAAIRKAQGINPATIAKALATRVVASGATMVAIDTVINEGSKALGLSEEGETPEKALAAFVIGAAGSGHAVSFKNRGINEVGEILARGNARQKAGMGLSERMTAEQAAEHVKESSSTGAMQKGLSPDEIEVWESVGREILKANADGKFPLDKAAVDRTTATVRQALFGGKPYGVIATEINSAGSEPGAGGPSGGRPPGGLPAGPAPAEKQANASVVTPEENKVAPTEENKVAAPEVTPEANPVSSQDATPAPTAGENAPPKPQDNRLRPTNESTPKPGSRITDPSGKKGEIVSESEDGSLKVEWTDGTTSDVAPNQEGYKRSTSTLVKTKNQVSIGRIGSSWAIAYHDAEGNFHRGTSIRFDNNTIGDAYDEAVRSATNLANEKNLAGYVGHDSQFVELPHPESKEVTPPTPSENVGQTPAVGNPATDYVMPIPETAANAPVGTPSNQPVTPPQGESNVRSNQRQEPQNTPGNSAPVQERPLTAQPEHAQPAVSQQGRQLPSGGEAPAPAENVTTSNAGSQPVRGTTDTGHGQLVAAEGAVKTGEHAQKGYTAHNEPVIPPAQYEWGGVTADHKGEPVDTKDGEQGTLRKIVSNGQRAVVAMPTGKNVIYPVEHIRLAESVKKAVKSGSNEQAPSASQTPTASNVPHSSGTGGVATSGKSGKTGAVQTSSAGQYGLPIQSKSGSKSTPRGSKELTEKFQEKNPGFYAGTGVKHVPFETADVGGGLATDTNHPHKIFTNHDAINRGIEVINQAGGNGEAWHGMGVDEEHSHIRDIHASHGRYEAVHNAIWGSLNDAEKAFVHKAYGESHTVTNSDGSTRKVKLTPAQKAGELIRMIDQYRRLGKITETEIPWSKETLKDIEKILGGKQSPQVEEHLAKMRKFEQAQEAETPVEEKDIESTKAEPVEEKSNAPPASEGIDSYDAGSRIIEPLEKSEDLTPENKSNWPPAPKGDYFRTKKGSVYEVNKNSTTRTKAKGIKEGDDGEKEPSQITVYVSPEGAKEVGMFSGLQGVEGRRIALDTDNKALTGNYDNPRTGQRKNAIGTYAYSLTPEAGYSPIELWKGEQKGYRAWHPGDVIIEVAIGNSETPTLDESAHEAATSPKNDLPTPSKAQFEAGNYQKGHVNISGLDISIENPSKSIRSGVTTDGKKWETKMHDHYGYIKGTVGADKDHVDVFVKPGTPKDWKGDVFVINQIDPTTGKFDETKSIIGARDEANARAIYARNYQAGWKGLGSIVRLPFDQFKDWAVNGDHDKPLIPEGYSNFAKPTIAQGKHFLFDAKEGDVAGKTGKGNLFIIGVYDKMKTANGVKESLSNSGIKSEVHAWLKKTAGAPKSMWTVLMQDVSQDFADEFNKQRNVNKSVSNSTTKSTPQEKRIKVLEANIKRLQKGTVMQSDIAAYYKPGTIVDSMYGKDYVEKFTPSEQGKGYGWNVSVREVNKEGKIVGRLRNHATSPGRVALLTMRQKELAEVKANPIPDAPAKTFSIRAARDSFGSDTRPVSAAVIAHGGLKSASTAKQEKIFDRNKDLWDDKPTLSSPTHNKIYSKGGMLPDQMAQALFDEGLLKEPTTEALWKQLGRESITAQHQAMTESKTNAGDKNQAVKDKAFTKEQSKQSGQPIEATNLSVGQKVKVGTEVMKVTGIDPDNFDVVLEDGEKYGIQHIADDQIIYGQMLKAKPPQLRSGEKGTGDLFQNADQPFNLMGEKTIDHAGRQAAKEKAEAEAQKAKESADNAQTTLFAKAPAVDTPQFKKWFGDSKVVDEDGEPLPVYHGTTHDFHTFDLSGNPESDFGSGIYFSNSPEDVRYNYAGKGPDLTNRIERRAEQIQDEREISIKEARDRAERELMTHEGSTMKVYLSLKKPLVIGGDNPTTWSLNYNEDTGEETGELVKFHSKLIIAAGRYNAEKEAQEAFSDAIGNTGEEDVDPQDFFDAMHKANHLIDATDDEGNIVSNEIIRDAIEEMGYDGIIDNTVNKKFGSERKSGQAMAGMDENTVHYIAFNANQVKSATGNNGNFDANEASMLRAKSPEERNLIAVHNLSAANLEHAIKMGGLAAPSMAIVRADKPAFDNFGDITLIAHHDLIDPQKNKNSKVFNADIYSPRYPNVKTSLPDGTTKKLAEFLKGTGIGDGTYGDTIDAIVNTISDDGLYSAMHDYPRFKEKFLNENGITLAKSNKTDLYTYRQDAGRAMFDNGLSDKYDKWIADLPKREGWEIKERIPDGFTNSGNRRYLPHDLDTVVKILKRKLNDGEGFNYGVPSVRAVTAKQFRTVKQIQADRNHIITRDEMDNLKEEVNDEFLKLAEEHGAEGPLDAFSDDMKALAKGGASDRQWIRERYPNGVPQQLRDFIEKLRNMPTQYFEAKIRRAVGLHEFDAAVVPTGTDPELIAALEKKGINVVKYKADDAEARRQAIQEAHPTALFARNPMQAWKDFKAGMVEKWNSKDTKDQMAYSRDEIDNQSGLTAEALLNRPDVPLKREFGKQHEASQRANSFVVEARGNKANLDKFARQVESSEPKNGRERSIKKQSLAAIQFAKDNWDKLSEPANTYSGVMDEVHAEDIKSGNVYPFRQGYVFHHYPAEYSAGGGAQGTKIGGSAKMRDFDTMAEAMENGMFPTSINSIHLGKARAVTSFTASLFKDWVESLKNDYKVKGTGNPIAKNVETVIRPDGTKYTTAPDGYTIENVAGQQIAIHHGFEGMFNALTADSFFDKSPARKSLLKVNALYKAIELLGDVFHMMRLVYYGGAIRMASIKDFRLPLPTYKMGYELLTHDEDQLRDMAARGEIPQSHVADLKRKKALVAMAIKSGFNVGKIHDNLAPEWVQKLPLLGTFNKFLFGPFQRGMMQEIWNIEYGRQRESYKKLTDEQVARQVTKSLNTRFGNLGRQGILKSPTAMHLAQLQFLAPQWTEGIIRSEMGALGQLGEFVKDAATGKQFASGLLLRSSALLAVGVFLANQLINWAFRGKPTWENPEEDPGAKISGFIPDFVGHGPGFFLNPLALPFETTHQLIEHYHKNGGDVLKVLVDYMRSHSSATLRPILTAIMQKDALGRPIKPGQQFVTIGKDLIPLPIPTSSLAGALKQIATGQPGESFAGQFGKQILSTLGIKTDQAPSPGQRISLLAREFNAKHGVTPSAEFYGGDYSDLTHALSLGNKNDAQAAMKELLLKKTKDDAIKHFQTWPRTPFTGQKAREAQFVQSLNPEQRSTYNKAKLDKQRIAMAAIQLLGRATPEMTRNSPDKKARYAAHTPFKGF